MKDAPNWLSHKPVITVDYEEKDANAGDAKFITIGKSSWNFEDFSTKIWRWSDSAQRWSRQSEEIPLWRVLDVATMLVAVINNKQSHLDEFVQDPEALDSLKCYVNDNMEMLAPRLKELSNVLNVQYQPKQRTNIPNIFSYATSELSQDAIIAWLLQWSNPVYKNEDTNLHAVAQDFLQMLLGETVDVKTIEVGRQWQNIDVYAQINDDMFLVIEDKTNTSIHDEQLERYKAIVTEEYKGKRNKLFFVYIKTGNEPLSTLKEIEKKGYNTISRIDIINCLSHYNGDNCLVNGYIEYLNDIEECTQNFRKSPVMEWDSYAWQGFYKELEKELDLYYWDYVANQAGGFWGAGWYNKDIPDGEIYLQFEESKFCFKIYYDGCRDRTEVRNECFEKILAIANQKGYDEITRPQRFGAGYYMTIAVVDSEYLFGNGLVNIKELVCKLKKYQGVIDEFLNN